VPRDPPARAAYEAVYVPAQAAHARPQPICRRHSVPRSTGCSGFVQMGSAAVHFLIAPPSSVSNRCQPRLGA
ncbi:hypothetical protein WOLCODRAFT_25502, partial [Wolfiporia cocos MD-104 SS10]